MIRQIVPSVIANEIVGVQPMYKPGLHLDSGVGYDPENDMGEWYWVRVQGASINQYTAMFAFCEEAFGAQGGVNWMYDSNSSRFIFTYEKDQMLFLLRWAQ